MMKKTQKTITKLFQGLLVIATLITMIVLGIFLWNLISSTPNEEEPPIVDPSVKQTFNFSINDYTLFEIEEFGFNFILADIHIESNKPINLSLSHFITSEDIQLNSVDTYLKVMENLGYNFGEYNPVFSLNSSETEMNATIFIPIKAINLTELDLKINIYPNHKLSFDLVNANNFGYLKDLGVNINNLDPSKVASIEVLNMTSVSPTEFYQIDSNGNKVEANFTSQSQIVAIKVKIISKISESFRITSAQIKNGGSVYDAVDKSYLIDGAKNLNNEYINNVIEGYLFFEVLGDISIDSFSEIHIFLSTNEDSFYTLPIKGN